MSKNKNKRTIRLKDRSDSELLQAAERAESVSKLKEAYGHYKELSKRHPEKYGDALLRIQVSRAEAFLQDGAFESAKQMIASLKGQVSNKTLKELELRATIMQTDNSEIADIAWDALDNKAGLNPKTYLSLLESLIFSGSVPPEDSLLKNSDVQTILAVREGFIAICENKSEALSEALSKIPRSSALAHWKLLLRALEAWYERNDELLEKCLQKLTDIEGKAARIFQALKLLQNKEDQVGPQSLNTALGIHSIHGLADDLLEIDKRIQKRNIPDAFKFAQKQFPRFMSQESEKDRIITEGFVRLYQYATPDDNYRKFINKLIADKRKPVFLRLPFLRASYKMGKQALDCPCSKCMFRQGQEYLTLLKENGISQKESAYLKYHFANRLMEEIEAQYGSLEKTELKLCSRILEEALQEDPEMIRAGLLLAKCHFDSGDTSKGNALLDELARKFPQDPNVLFAAGCRCIERKTFVRGLKQLEQAYSIDPHLPNLAEKYVEGLLAHALYYYKKRILDKGRNCFEKMKPHLRKCPSDADFVLGTRWMRLRQFEMETSYGGDPEQLQPELGQDWQGKETLREIFSHMITEHFGNPGRIRNSVAKLEKLFSGKMLAKKLEPEDIFVLLAYIKHSQSNNNKQMANENQCLQFIRHYREIYVKERLEGIIKLLWASIPDYIYPGGILQLTKIWSKADRQNPQLKLMQITALEAFGESADELLDHLDKAIQTARDRGDEFALQKGNELRKKIEAANKTKHFDPSPRFDQPDNEDDDEFDDDELARMESDFEEMYQKWRSLDDDERRHFEKEVEAITGKLPAKALLEIFKERMKADNRKSTFPGNKTNEANDASQMNFSF